jgi:hypothetical protein
MSQNDLVIANQTFPATRADINSALQALGSTNSGPSAPSTTYANMMWYDTTANILKIRSEANDGWISIGYLHQGENQFHILDDTYVADASGVHTGLLGDQSTATWQAGTGTTESLVSPAKVLAAIEANVEGITHTSGSAPYYGVRAWGRIDGNVKVDGGNFASFNSASNTVTFTTPMPHANYAVTLNGPWYGNVFAQSETVNGFQAVGVSSGGNVGDISSFEFIVVC